MDASEHNAEGINMFFQHNHLHITHSANHMGESCKVLQKFF